MKTLFVSLYCLVFGLFLGVTTVQAADLSVFIVDAAGKPVKDAVVTFTPAAGVNVRSADLAGPFVMAQKNIMFNPFVLAVPVGATVSFPNQDRVNHHVYSFSPVQAFQFPLYGQGKTHTQSFTKAGTVALGCNIHDSMIAYIRVVATPYYATSDESGRVTLRNVPEGGGKVVVWQPLMEAQAHEAARDITLAATNTTLNFNVKLRPVMPASVAY